MSPKEKTQSATMVPLAEAAGPGNIPVIDVPSGSTLEVIVDVGPMAIPYAVHYGGRTLIKSLVDRAEDVAPLQAGDRVLGWAFAHAVKGWHHTIGCSVDGGDVQVLESKSEAGKDSDHSVGFAIVRS